MSAVWLCCLKDDDLGAEWALIPPRRCRLNSAASSLLNRSSLLRRCSYPSSRRIGDDDVSYLVNEESVVGYLVLGDEGHSEEA